MTRTELERLAVVERDIKHLTERHEEFRDEVRGEFRSVKADFASVRDDVAEIKELLTQARGGLRVMRFGWGAFAKGAGWIGGLAAAGAYIWEKLSALLMALPR
jgi:hypothetical protein